MKYIYITFFLITATIEITYGQLSRELIKFRELDVTDKIRVTLIPSNEDRLIIEGELANQLELTQIDDVLRLKMTAGYNLQGQKVDVSLYTSHVSSVIARKGAVVTMDKGELALDSIYLSANEGARINMRIHTKEVEAWTTTGATIKLEGETKNQTINSAFGGFYEADNLLSDYAYVRTNAGGKCKINAGKSVDVQTRAGGVIDIYGNPTERKKSRIAGGKINFIN